MKAYRDLQEFLEVLERKGELLRIKREVSPELEITEITDRVVKQAGPALLFERVKGSSIPVVTNLFGTEERVCLALGVKSLDELSQRIMDFLELKVGEGLFAKLRLLPKVLQAKNLFPRMVDKAPCQEVVIQGEDVDLFALPILKCWPEDGGRYITLPCVITKDPETGKRNVGMYRMQVFERNRTGMHWQMHKVGARHYQKAERLVKALPVAVAIGPDPAVIYSATAPVPEDVDEFMLAGFLRGEPVPLVRCLTVPLEVPANSQIVLEGYVEPFERRMEGPFGDHTGFYTEPEPFPVFTVQAITMRRSAIYPATIVGKPPQEDAYLGKATERLFLPLIKLVIPEVVDINLPVEGAFHNFAFVSIEKRYPGQAYKVAQAIWGLGQLMFTKFVIVFDAHVNVKDLREVIFYLGANVDPARDIIIVKGPVDHLDHAVSNIGFGGKVCIDATTKLKEEGYTRTWPKEIAMSPEVKRRIDRLWQELSLDKILEKYHGRRGR